MATEEERDHTPGGEWDHNAELAAQVRQQSPHSRLSVAAELLSAGENDPGVRDRRQMISTIANSDPGVRDGVARIAGSTPDRERELAATAQSAPQEERPAVCVAAATGRLAEHGTPDGDTFQLLRQAAREGRLRGVGDVSAGSALVASDVIEDVYPYGADSVRDHADSLSRSWTSGRVQQQLDDGFRQADQSWQDAHRPAPATQTSPRDRPEPSVRVTSAGTSGPSLA